MSKKWSIQRMGDSLSSMCDANHCIPKFCACAGLVLYEYHLREREINLAQKERSLLELERRWRGGEQLPQMSKLNYAVYHIMQYINSFIWFRNRSSTERQQAQETKEKEKATGTFSLSTRQYHTCTCCTKQIGLETRWKWQFYCLPSFYTSLNTSCTSVNTSCTSVTTSSTSVTTWWGGNEGCFQFDRFGLAHTTTSINTWTKHTRTDGQFEHWLIRICI